jgi:hypothetical protein
MVQINTLMQKGSTGQVSIPRDELEMCGLINDDGKPRTDIQLLVQMTEPGEWHVSVLNDDVVDDSWYDGDGAPDTGVSVSHGGSGRR